MWWGYIKHVRVGIKMSHTVQEGITCSEIVSRTWVALGSSVALVNEDKKLESRARAS